MIWWNEFLLLKLFFYDFIKFIRSYYVKFMGKIKDFLTGHLVKAVNMSRQRKFDQLEWRTDSVYNEGF